MAPLIDVNIHVSFFAQKNTSLCWIIVYLWGHIWVHPPASIENNLAHLSNTISFQQILWNQSCLSKYLFGGTEYGQCGNNNHNHSNTKQKIFNHEELQSSVSSVIWGGLCWPTSVPLRKESSSLALWWLFKLCSPLCRYYQPAQLLKYSQWVPWKYYVCKSWIDMNFSFFFCHGIIEWFGLEGALEII